MSYDTGDREHLKPVTLREALAKEISDVVSSTFRQWMSMSLASWDQVSTTVAVRTEDLGTASIAQVRADVLTHKSHRPQPL